MLTDLLIKNFIIIDQWHLTFNPGMTVLSGETGEGKSMMVNALHYALGARSDSQVVKHNQQQADICAIFAIHALPQAQDWLATHQLLDGDECHLRRVIQKDGRSRSYINGQILPLQQVRELADMLINVHSQHQHTELLKPSYQRQWLDNFGGYPDLLLRVQTSYKQWQSLQQRLADLTQGNPTQDRQTLLKYQLDEINAAEVKAGEVEQLISEQKCLQQADTLIANCHTSIGQLSENEQAIDHQLHQIARRHNDLAPVAEEIHQAIIHCQEAKANLLAHIAGINRDPQYHQAVEQRLSLLFDLARKHKVPADNLFALQQQLMEEYQQLQGKQKDIEALQQQIAGIESDYRSLATQLSEKRQQAASNLQTSVSKLMQSLGMKGGELHIVCQPMPNEKPLLHGLDDVQFLVRTNPGQSLQSIQKVASGGELSRISLAIQVLTAQQGATASLLFDEVDVGIGGRTATMVAQCLRQLSEKTPLIVVTHLAQVAAHGHHHWRVSKMSGAEETTTTITQLDKKQRVEEIARMLGGMETNKQSLAHAKEMLNDKALATTNK